MTMINNPLPRLDADHEIRDDLLPYCRLRPGDIWYDPVSGHRVGCLDAADPTHIDQLMDGNLAQLAIHDPPYNLVAFDERPLQQFTAWCHDWIETTRGALTADSALYIWLGADQRDGFQPLPDFMMMMRDTPFVSRSFITLRNQRGYGTQNNWMAVRQELLYYTQGKPPFSVQYTAIPKTVSGYYKEINGNRTENLERGRANTIRASNVWADIQQVFYRMHENVSGCYAQKPLTAIERIVQASSLSNERVLDFFAHSGTTLLACERLGRTCYTCDIDPVFCEITIRRLENFRKTGSTGWQNDHPFTEIKESG